MSNIGERVGAIRNSNDGIVYMFGFGVYEGREIPPEEIGLPIPNPKIKLDDGSVVWGCQCWWGPEQQIRQKIGDREIVFVPVNENGGKNETQKTADNDVCKSFSSDRDEMDRANRSNSFVITRCIMLFKKRFKWMVMSSLSIEKIGD